MALGLFLIVGAFKNTAVGRSDSIYDNERCDWIWNLGRAPMCYRMAAVN